MRWGSFFYYTPRKGLDLALRMATYIASSRSFSHRSVGARRDNLNLQLNAPLYSSPAKIFQTKKTKSELNFA
jgi:hypothetical protein